MHMSYKFNRNICTVLDLVQPYGLYNSDCKKRHANLSLCQFLHQDPMCTHACSVTFLTVFNHSLVISFISLYETCRNKTVKMFSKQNYKSTRNSETKSIIFHEKFSRGSRPAQEEDFHSRIFSDLTIRRYYGTISLASLENQTLHATRCKRIKWDLNPNPIPKKNTT